MMKLGDLPKMQELAKLRDQLPKAEPEEKRDPAAVASRRLLELADLCRKHRRRLPQEVQDHLKVVTAAVGRIS